VNKIEIDYSRFESKQFGNAQPFPHIVVDNFLPSVFAETLEKNYPNLDDVSWWKYHNHFEKKLACNDLNTLHTSFRNFFNFVNSREFVLELEKLTGIKGLLADPSLHGGGLHRIGRGGKLDVHADFNYHKVTGWRRRLNLILYLNEGWDEDYGGHTEFWDKKMSACEKKILPIMNRMSLFIVDDDCYHGHPDPLNCPKTTARKSLAVYYYTLHDDELSTLEYHSTDYKKRPTDATDNLIEDMRVKRRKGRLEDMST